MQVLNEHSREFAAPAVAVGRLLDSLASAEDGLWPHEVWPAVRFNGRLAPGREGGHGPIRYRIEAYEPGHRVVFRFTSPRGFRGTHRFQVEEEGAAGRVRLRHVLHMQAAGWARLSWPLVFRPLHDALLEDALDKAEARLSGSSWERRTWTRYVRLLRRVLGRRARLAARASSAKSG